MGQNNRECGSSYEDMAVEHLQSLGYEIIERNWHFSNRGEIDIVAIDPCRFKQPYLVFVEVKFRRESLQMSLLALSQKKIRQLVWLAKAYMTSHKINPNQTNVSFDFIAISRAELEHIKNIV